MDINPDYYKSSYKDQNYEVIDIIAAFKLNYNLGNSIKYILRAGKKNKDTFKEDINKAIWYLNRETNV
jgi:hypothetical protein